MARNKIISTLLLWPISKIYGIVTSVRNLLFDIGILKQCEFDIPVIVVGNITVGGTGKTPHTEYLISMLKSHYNIGVLSRGYKRYTRGFRVADKKSLPHDIGDEPYQMYCKYGQDVMVAVCENRCEGIRQMRALNPDINLVILDDAFQHRYVKPKISIVLTEYSRPIFNDKLLPLGRLRESLNALNRADIVVVTKCPVEMKPMDCRIFINNLNLYPYQKLFFSSYAYGNLVPVFPAKATYIPQMDWLNRTDTILALSGIANPRPFVKYLKQYRPSIKVKIFEDHHNFTVSDYEEINNRYNSLKGDRKFIITTEKDAVRLSCDPDFPENLKQFIFYLPISVSFGSQNEVAFEVELNKMIKRKL